MIRSILAALLLLMSFAMSTIAQAEDLLGVRVLSAGSLRAAMDDMAAVFSADTKIKIDPAYGPAGVLRERIEKGEAADLFTSADLGSPLALARAGKAGPVVLFARNKLCAFVRPGLKVTSATLLATMLDSKIKLGTSTPKADPAGDYTWAMFAKADSVRPGNRAKLEAKAIQLMGGPASPAPPPGADIFAWNVREGRADIFIAYCTATQSFTKQLPEGTVVALPPAIATGADYGLTILSPNNPSANRFALFILSQAGQEILAKHGFDAPLLTEIK